MIATIICILLILAILASIYQKFTHPICKSIERLDGKVALVTGGTSGIGYEVAKDLAQRGAKVIIACPFEQEGNYARRKIEKDTVNNKIIFKVLDLASFASVRNFASNILKNEERLDILVNNAGGFFNRVTEDGLHATMQVNYLGHFLLTILLLPLMKKSTPSRIVNVTAMVHRFGNAKLKQLTSTNYKFPFVTYADSKLCMVLFANELSRRLKNTNVIVNSVDPGWAGTNILHKLLYNFINDLLVNIFSFFYKSASDGAQTVIHACVDTNVNTITGGYFKDCRLYKSAQNDYSERTSHELWEHSIRLVHLEKHDLLSCLLL